MRYRVLAADYDGTLAHDGKVDDATVAALRRFRDSGRKLVMVTGRVMPELRATFGHVELFERIVAENGALVHDPATLEEKILTPPPKPEFVETLKKQGVSPIETGRVIVATWEPHEKTVLKTIRDMGLELQIIFNKGAVMILPTGVNKATGLKAALKILGETPETCVAVGDAENDHAMLALAGVGVAVSNTAPAVKERADLVTKGDHVPGVAELIDRILADDLADVTPKSARRRRERAAVVDDRRYFDSSPPKTTAWARPRTVIPANGEFELFDANRFGSIVHDAFGSITATSAIVPTCSVPASSRPRIFAGFAASFATSCGHDSFPVSTSVVTASGSSVSRPTMPKGAWSSSRCFFSDASGE